MKAVRVNSYGTYEVLEFVENLPVPKILPNQVLTDNYAVGLNPHDIYLRKGVLAGILKERLPIIPGLDIAGKIVKVGKDVEKFKVGDMVYGMMDANTTFSSTGFAKTGGYAEYSVTREDTLSLIPKGISTTEAASIPLVALTAYQALVKKAGVQANQKILINGASGGVGSMAIQIANYLDLKVTAVCHSYTNEFVSGLHPQKIINYDVKDFTTESTEYDIIFDIAGNKSYDLCKDNLSETGLYISNVPNENTLKAYQSPEKENKFGFHEKNKYNWVLPSGEDLEEISQLIMSGHVRPVVTKIFDFHAVQEAHQYMEQNIAKGKVILNLKPDN